MKELCDCKMLLTVSSGFAKYVYDNFINNNIIFCHPIVKTVFLPKQCAPENVVFDAKVADTFLTSKNGQDWGANYNDMIDTVMNGGNFYIADFKLNVYISVEAYMLMDIVEILESNVDGLVHLPDFRWKNGRLGELEYFTMDEFLSNDKGGL